MNIGKVVEGRSGNLHFLLFEDQFCVNGMDRIKGPRNNWHEPQKYLSLHPNLMQYPLQVYTKLVVIESIVDGLTVSSRSPGPDNKHCTRFLDDFPGS